MYRAILVIGAGGHGREAHDVIEAINGAAEQPTWTFLGFVDEGQPDEDLLAARDTTLLGGLSHLSTCEGAWYVVGIGDPKARRRLDRLASQHGLLAATLVHPSATLGANVTLSEGVIVGAHSSITTNVKIGRHTHVNVNSTISHDVVIGDFATVGPGVNVAGNVNLGDDVTMGIGSTVIQGRVVGKEATVGASALVVRDVREGVVVVGVPAKELERDL